MIDCNFKSLGEYFELQRWLISLRDRGQKSAWGEAMRHLCMEDLFYLTAFVMSDGRVINTETGNPLYIHQFYVDWCREVEVQWEAGGGLDMSARGSGKSTIRTKALNIKRMLKYPNSNGGLFSFTRGAAKKHYQGIKEELERNELLKTLFDDLLFWDPISAARQGKIIWSREEGIRMKPHNRKDYSLQYFAYFDGQPTGARLDHASLDDVEDHKAIGTELMLEALHRGLDATIPLLTPVEINPAVTMVTNTAYSDTGLVMRYYRMLKERGDEHLIRNYPAERLDVSGPGPLGGTPQYPYSEHRLQKMYDEMSDKSEYAVQFCGDFTAGEDRTFNEAWLQWYDRVPMEWGRGKLIYVCIDPSRGVKDPMCIWVWGTGADKKFHWLDCSVKKLDVALPEFMDEIVRVVTKWAGIGQRVVEIRVEQFGQSTYAEMIKTEMTRRGFHYDVVPCNYNIRTGKFESGKRDREFEYWAPNLSTGQIVFPRSTDEGGPGIISASEKGVNRDLVKMFLDQEYRKFPKPVSDHMLDAGGLLFEPVTKTERQIQFPRAGYNHNAKRRKSPMRGGGMSLG